MNKHFLNEKGITLVELLAALSLFAIVSALVMTVLFNVFLNSKNISDNAQLRQDANLLVSTLRSHYNQDDLEEDEFEVSLENGNILLIDGQEVNSSMTSSIDELELKNGENSISAVNPAVNQSMIVKADGTPLSIDLTLKNEAGQTYNLFTTIEKPEELAIALPVFEKIDVPNRPDPPDTNDYTKVFPPVYPIDIPITGNIKYVSSNGYQLIPDGCGDIKIDGDVWLYNTNPHNVVEMKHDAPKFIVTKNLFVDSVFKIHNYHPMDVQGHALFYTNLELIDRGKFTATNIHAVGGDHNGNGIVVGNQTRLEARESIDVGKTFYINGNTFVDENNQTILSKDVLSEGEGHVIIGKNLIANTVEAVNDSIININGSASISNKLLAKGRSLIKIGKNLIIDGDLEMSGNVKIIVEGSARIDGDLILGGTSILKVKGNLTVTGDVEPDGEGNKGTLDVEGKTNFSKGKPSWLVED
ncbi:prepilin-type N-terminal cleavage/methylation domain-containing protein [Jeotgalibaca arthritidis]|uniref:Prepilin-type N-terminal cleavage/methylation domain-containing protein n=1 Tax=Jeotgalibaca arthritidis TaxID=1868794 RepID=A0A6G7K7L0_9LACT|nr:prepilin-type N-terminal cleavage/methylation domain-containing protein [Jeotgalibaca arthritidis]QII81240.1 hypothetical protein G7057_01315 [Jeotgalibaca arthritidis]